MTTDLKEKVSATSDSAMRGVASLRLHVMVDVSSSMDERGPHGGKKIELVEKKLSDFLKGKNFKTITLSVFDTSLYHLGSYTASEEVERALAAYLRNTRLTGGTKIWDNIGDILGLHNGDENLLIVCITDGMDQGSRKSCNDIMKKVKSSERIELVILDIAGHLKKSVKDKDADTQSAVKLIEDPESLDLHLDTLLKKYTVVEIPSVEVKVSYPVIPLVECSSETVEHVRESMAKIVPYLQTLAGLRYYPVMTCLVDQHLLHEILPDRKRNPGSHACQLKEEIQEINEFILGVILTVHCRSFSYSRGRYVEGLDDDYAGFISLSEETRRAIQSWCEWLPCEVINCILDGKYIHGFHGRGIYLEELSPEPEPVGNCHDFLMAVLEILKNVRTRYGGSLLMGRVHHRFSESERRGPDLEKWKKLMSKKDFIKIQAAVDQEGYWINDLDHMVPVFEASIRTIFPLLKKMGNISMVPVVTTLHTYGIYSHAGNSGSALQEHLNKAGFPAWFSLSQSALVFICIEEIEGRLKEAAALNPGIDEASLRKKLIFETLLHEHTHAIIDEGMEGNENGGRIADLYAGKKADILNESLAEWSALNYFRNDQEMFDIIRQHALQGDLPEWSYAGALAVEQKFGKAGLTAFRSLLHLLRSNPEEAYKYLRTA